MPVFDDDALRLRRREMPKREYDACHGAGSRDDCSESARRSHAPLGVRSPTSNGLSATAFLSAMVPIGSFSPGTAASRYYRRPRVKLRTLAYFEFSGRGSDINPGTRAGARSRTRAAGGRRSTITATRSRSAEASRSRSAAASRSRSRTRSRSSSAAASCSRTSRARPAFAARSRRAGAPTARWQTENHETHSCRT